MNGSLGRDRIWNDHIWSEIDRAVREEVGRARIAQKVFPSTVVNNVLPVSANRAVAAPIVARAKRAARGVDRGVAPAIDQFQPFFEISREFVLTQAQVDGEENLHLAASLARLAASALANAEDTILFLGRHFIPALVGVNVTNQHAVPPGFVAEANIFESIVVPPKQPDPNAPLGEILAAIAEGMAKLNTDGQPGPYALFLAPNRYAQTFAPVKPGSLRTPGDQIKEVVTGGFYMVNSLASVQAANLSKARSEALERARSEQNYELVEQLQRASLEDLEGLWNSDKLPVAAPEATGPPPPHWDIGILVSLGGEPAKIILGTEATTAFTRVDEQSNYHFRVFERIQMVVRDGRAFQTLEWPKKGQSPNRNHANK